MISIKLNVLKIDKNSLFKGEKGTYLDAMLHDKPNDFSDGYITQSVSKEKREAGEKGPVIGSWKHLQTQSKPAPPTKREETDDIPF